MPPLRPDRRLHLMRLTPLRLLALALPLLALAGCASRGPACSGDTDYLTQINPDSVRTIRAKLEPGLRDAKPDDRFQFERHGYFVADVRDSKPGAPVFNRAVTLRDTFGKGG